MFESIFTPDTEIPITMAGLLISLGSALVLGLLISFAYMKTHKTNAPSQSFALTLVALPAVIAVIILLVGSNVARAFSLAGAFSIIRFRSAPGDPKDITFVLFSMAVGLAAGMGFVAYAAAVGVALCAVMGILKLINYGRPNGTEKILKITIPENLNYQDAFDEPMKKYTLSSTLKKVETADLGSLYELRYAVTFKNGLFEKDFIDELRCRNGNLNITLVLDSPSNAEF